MACLYLSAYAMRLKRVIRAIDEEDVSSGKIWLQGVEVRHLLCLIGRVAAGLEVGRVAATVKG